MRAPGSNDAGGVNNGIDQWCLFVLNLEMGTDDDDDDLGLFPKSSFQSVI